MSQGNNGLSRGDRNRNARLAALRVVLPRDQAILGYRSCPVAAGGSPG